MPTRSTPKPAQRCQHILPSHSSGGFILSGSDRYHAFGPVEQLEVLHPSNGRSGGQRYGVVSFAKRDPHAEKPWREWKTDVSEAAQQAKEIIGRGEMADFYVSHQSFLNWRSISQLRSLGCLYVDIDYRTRSRWKDQKPRDVLIAIHAVLEESKIPSPSYALDTGRGLNLVWLHDLLPRTALSRWAAVQKQLAAALKAFGADPMALDAARVFRVVGSINSRADWERRVVGMIWCQGDPTDPYRYDFDNFADEVLPLTRGKLIALRAERAKRRANGENLKSPKLTLTSARVLHILMEAYPAFAR